MKLLKSLAILSLLAPTLLLAEGEENHVGVGTRHMSEEALAEKEKQAAGKEEGTLEISGYIFDSYPPLYYSSSAHRLIGIVIDNDQYNLQLEDGSEWRIHNFDGNKALNWRANDPLTITQNTRWFTKYNYVIINKSNGTKVEAKLFRGPIVNGEFSRVIISLDKDHKEIMLNDGTHWEVSYLDSSVFNDWQLGDYIIIGTNSNTSIFDSEKDGLLINVNMDNYVRAKQF